MWCQPTAHTVGIMSAAFGLHCVFTPAACVMSFICLLVAQGVCSLKRLALPFRFLQTDQCMGEIGGAFVDQKKVECVRWIGGGEYELHPIASVCLETSYASGR